MAPRLAREGAVGAVRPGCRALRGIGPGQRLTLATGRGTVPASVGAGQLEHDASVALVDALYLAVSLSDNVAADALLDLVPWTEATALLRELGLRHAELRSRFAELTQTPAEQLADTPDLANVVAMSAALASGGHRLAALDLSRTSTSTPHDLASMLRGVWDPRDTPVHPDDARHLRRLLRADVHRQRLWQEFATPASTWASRTGAQPPARGGRRRA